MPMPARRERRKKLRRMFVLGLLLAVALVAAAPTIVSRTPLRNLILNSRLAPRSSQLVFHVHCEQAAFSWLGGQSLQRLSITDQAGQQVLAVEAVSVGRSLVQLLAGTSELGKIQIVRPQLFVTARTDGSNVEDLLGSLQFAADKENALAEDTSIVDSSLSMQLEIDGGMVEAYDQTSGSRWVLSGINAQLQLADGNVASAVVEGKMVNEARGVNREAPDQVQAIRSSFLAPQNSAGSFKLRLHSEDADWQQLDMVADQLVLDAVSPWFVRAVPGGHIEGKASLDGVLQWAKNLDGDQSSRALKWKSSGNLQASQLRIAANVLEGDVLECQQLTVPWRLAASGNILTIEQLTADTEWGKFAAKGAIDIAQLAMGKKGPGTIDRNGPKGASHQWYLAPFFPSLPNQDGQLEASFNIARLAAMLPDTLHIRPGVQIDSGELQLVANSFAASVGSRNSRRKWTTRIALQNLAGNDTSHSIRWDQPVELAIDVDQPLGNLQFTPRVSRLVFRSPFLEANLKTAVGVVDGNVSFDLKKLADQVGQLVDLSPWQMSGQGSGTVVLQSLADERFKASALVDLQSLSVTRQDQQGNEFNWNEPLLHVNMMAGGETGAAGQGLGVGEQNAIGPFFFKKIDTASVQLRGASDSFELQLTEPVDIAWKKGSGTIDAKHPSGRSGQWYLTPFSNAWPISVHANGQLAAWAGRIRPWTSSLPDELQGNAELTATIRVGPMLVDVSESKLQVTRLHARSDSFVVDEPQVQLTGDCRWDVAAGSLTTGQLQLVTSTVSLLTRNVAFAQSRADENDIRRFDARGDMAFRADLERLAAVLGFVGGSSAVWPRGMATGQVQLSTQGRTALADLTLVADQLQIIQTSAEQSVASSSAAARVAWTEPRVDMAAKLNYDTRANQFRLDDLRVASQAFQLRGSAIVEQLASEGTLRADGLIDYDWEALSAILATYVGPEVHLYGKDQARFQVAGNIYGDRPNAQFRNTSSGNSNSTALHWSQQWTALTDARVASGSVYGLPLGALALQLKLGSGMLQTAPIDVPVGQGQLTLNPSVVFYPQPRQLLLPQGPLITNVRVSPEVSEQMLKYIAPVVAGATRTDGLFSIRLEGARVPLENPRQADIAGQLAIHQLNISPGPTVQELVNLVEQIEAIANRRPLSTSGTLSGKNVVTIDNRNVDFRLFEGRAYHRGLEFMVDGVPVRSSGSVGFDQTLDITFEVPIQDRWVERQRALQPLAGQVLRIPIRGTFQQPQIDQRAVADLSRRMFQGVAERALGDEINKQLRKLLRSK